MLALRETVVVLTLIFSQSHALHSYLRYWSVPHDAPYNLTKGTLFINYDDTFPLARCNDTKPKLEKTCTVILTKPYRRDRICHNIKITAGKDRELFLGGYFQVLPFSHDKAILVWYDTSKEVNSTTSESKEQDFRFKILDFEKCTTANLSFAVDKIAYGFFPTLVFYNNQIDVVLNSKSSCGGADRCKLSFDLNGKQIGGINPYEPEVSQYASAVSPSSPDKGFFVSNQDLKEIQVLLVDSAGKGKELLKANLIANASAQRVAFSNGHELYGTCWTSEEDIKPSEIHCAQFNATGKQKFNTTVKTDKSVRSLSVRNLRQGGLLLLTAIDNSEERSNRNLNVTYVHKNGDVNKSFLLDGPKRICFNKTSELEVRVYESHNGFYCFEYACTVANKNLILKGKCLLLQNEEQS